MDNPVLRIVTQRGDADCCIAVLAMYLDRTYEDVLVAAAQLNTTIHKKGMWTHQIETTAKALGTPLRRRRKWDLETDSGILSLTSVKYHQDHVVVLRAGLVFDTDGTVWEPEVHFATRGYKPTILLERDERHGASS